MKSMKLAGALAALGLVATPLAANANLSRASASFSGENELGGGEGATVAVIFALIAVGVGFIALDDNDEPVSA